MREYAFAPRLTVNDDWRGGKTVNCYRRLPASFATENEMKLEPQLIAAKYLPEIQIHSP